jgi:hypothetical protein
VTVRSTRLGAYTVSSSGWNLLFTCPAGWRTIVRDIRVDGSSSAGGDCVIVIQDNALSENLNVFHETLAANAFGSWTGWVVLNPGNSIAILYTGQPFAAWGSGTLLKLTGTEAP